MWDVQIQTYCKKEAEDGKANRCSEPESPSLFTQQIYFSSIFQGVLADADDSVVSYNHAIEMSRHGECLFHK